jgi:sensor histidine kinase YesM
MKIRLSEKFYLFELSKIFSLFVWFLISTLAYVLTPGRILKTDVLVRESIIEFFVDYLIISLLYFLLAHIKKDTGKRIFFVLRLFLVILPLPFLLVFLVRSINSVIVGQEITFPHYLADVFYCYYPVVAFTVVFYLVNHMVNLKNQKEMTLIANNLANEAQLQMLRYQINPHFLFNSLNTIRSMVEEDKSIARKMITELANFFRYSLSHDGITDTFENEISAIKNYLEIQKIRFEEKLIIVYDIDENTNNLKIPIFIILPLVENAVKFGLQTSKIPLNIKICAKINHNLEISVSNTGRIIENAKKNDGTNTGIDNTRKRLALYFPDNYTFKLYQDDQWVVAQITITDFRNHLPL